MSIVHRRDIVGIASCFASDCTDGDVVGRWGVGYNHPTLMLDKFSDEVKAMPEFEKCTRMVVDTKAMTVVLFANGNETNPFWVGSFDSSINGVQPLPPVVEEQPKPKTRRKKIV